MLRAALNTAIRWRLVNANAAALIDAPRLAAQDLRTLTPDQAEQLLDAARDHALEGFVTVALGCGLRLGAALGLTRADIDLDGGTVRVRQALQRAGRDSAVRRALTAERRRLKNARVRYQKGIFIVKYEGKRAKGQKYALNPSRIEDITTLANEGTVSDPLVEQ